MDYKLLTIAYYSTVFSGRAMRRHNSATVGESSAWLQLHPAYTLASPGLCNRFGMRVNIDFWIDVFHRLFAQPVAPCAWELKSATSRLYA